MQVLEGVRTILNIFVKQGYALSASVAEVGEASDGRHSFKVGENPSTVYRCVDTIVFMFDIVNAMRLRVCVCVEMSVAHVEVAT